MAGVRFNLDERVYLNTRAGAGYIAFRSDDWPNKLTGPIPALDVNLGVYF